MINEAEVYFALFGENVEPDEITKIVGLEPTEAQRREPPKKSSWKLSSGKVAADHIDIYEISSALVSRLLPQLGEIQTAIHHHHLESVLEVVLWISTDEGISTPAIGFDSRVISFLSSVGAEIDIDTYLA